jgi:ankyrin repeat protein
MSDRYQTDRRNWSKTHFDVHNGRIPLPTMSVLTPPQGDLSERNSSCNVNEPGPGGLTPLMVASMAGASGGSSVQQYSSVDCIQVLLSEGAKTDARSDYSGIFFH